MIEKIVNERIDQLNGYLRKDKISPQLHHVIVEELQDIVRRVNNG
jgi:hypothetical protein